MLSTPTANGRAPHNEVLFFLYKNIQNLAYVKKKLYLCSRKGFEQ